MARAPLARSGPFDSFPGGWEAWLKEGPIGYNQNLEQVKNTLPEAGAVSPAGG